VESPEGKKSLQETAEAIRQIQMKTEQTARDLALWWAENKHKPMII
jgi:hypothetical protein